MYCDPVHLISLKIFFELEEIIVLIIRFFIFFKWNFLNIEYENNNYVCMLYATKLISSVINVIKLQK